MHAVWSVPVESGLSYDASGPRIAGRTVSFGVAYTSTHSKMTETQAAQPSARSEINVTPFLKWAGGKRWLVRGLDNLIDSFSGTYIEPFAGSAAVFFALTPARAILSDANEDLIETYKAIAKNWRLVVKYLRQHQALHSKDYYYEMRASRPRGQFERAAKFIYLNRTCWNGLYRVNQRGEFNVPIGTKDSVLLDSDDFELVAQVLADTELVASDFEVQIDRANEGDFIFVDPPYTVKHKFNGFVKYNEQLFAWSDQVRLRDSLWRAKQRGAKILLTNADHESIRALYSADFEMCEVNRFSSIAGKGGARGSYPELLIR